jgi:hypothetical protein
MLYPKPVHISSVFSSRSDLHPPAHKQSPRSWWGPVWRGLLVEDTAKHYKNMGRAVWLYMYLIVHADRRTGMLRRLMSTIAKDMGLKTRTIRAWLAVLRKHGYIRTSSTGRALEITIQKWKPLQGRGS